MRRTIKIGDKDIDMLATATTPILYKRLFRQDFLATALDENMDCYAELSYIMARQAEGLPPTELIGKLKIEEFYAWLDTFGPMDFVNAASDIFAFYNSQTKTTSIPKKKKPRRQTGR